MSGPWRSESANAPKRHERQSDKGRGGLHQFIKRIGGVDAAEGGGKACRRERRGHVVGFRRGGRFAVQGIAGEDQGSTQQQAEEDLQGWRDQAIVIGIFDEEQAADGNGNATDPDEPAGRQRLFHILLWRLGLFLRDRFKGFG